MTPMSAKYRHAPHAAWRRIDDEAVADEYEQEEPAALRDVEKLLAELSAAELLVAR